MNIEFISNTYDSSNLYKFINIKNYMDCNLK